MTGVELSRIVRVRPQPPETLTVTAEKPERAALAERFGVVAIDALTAEIALAPDGQTIVARGRLRAALIQTCAVSGEDFAAHIDEPLDLRFVPAGSIAASEEEIELVSDGPDEIEFHGDSVDLGEAVAQSLGLAIDPYAEGPGADAARQAAGITDDATPRGALADLLAGLKRN